MPIAWQPPIPKRFKPLHPCRIARIGAVINIKARQLVETNHAIERALRQRTRKLFQPRPITRDVAQAASTEKFDADIFRPIPLPSTREDRHVVPARSAELRGLQTIP